MKPDGFSVGRVSRGAIMDEAKRQKLLSLLKDKEKRIKESKKGKLRFFETQTPEHEEAEKLLRDFENHPHAFVLACMMERGIKSEKACKIPYIIKKKLGDFSIETLIKKKGEVKKLFKDEALHHYWDRMSERFTEAVYKIRDDYQGRADRIWLDDKGKPKSSKDAMIRA